VVVELLVQSPQVFVEEVEDEVYGVVELVLRVVDDELQSFHPLLLDVVLTAGVVQVVVGWVVVVV
jgi:hypothetical protein